MGSCEVPVAPIRPNVELSIFSSFLNKISSFETKDSSNYDDDEFEIIERNFRAKEKQLDNEDTEIIVKDSKKKNLNEFSDNSKTILMVSK